MLIPYKGSLWTVLGAGEELSILWFTWNCGGLSVVVGVTLGVTELGKEWNWV